jgi:hypothetical protein
MDMPFDVLESEFAQRVEFCSKAVPHRLAQCARDDYPPWWRLLLKAGGDVHAISIKIVAVDDQVAQVQAHAEHKGSISRLVGVGLGHILLELDGGAQRVNCAGELD